MPCCRIWGTAASPPDDGCVTGETSSWYSAWRSCDSGGWGCSAGADSERDAILVNGVREREEEEESMKRLSDAVSATAEGLWA